MNERSKFIKVRVSETEYRTLRQRADAQGVTMSEHVRATVTAVHKDVDVAAELASLRQQLREPAPATASAGNGSTATEQREMLLLLRELAAARDAQILVRVRAQLGVNPAAQNQQRGVAA